MTEKHFEALASELKYARPTHPHQSVESAFIDKGWQRSVNAVADVCARFNPHFDRARFLKACEQPLGVRAESPERRSRND